jgi:hypothetical protein
MPSAMTTNSSPPKTICEIGHARSRHDVEHDTLEHLVSGQMPEAIIERLEMIDIDQQ